MFADCTSGVHLDFLEAPWPLSPDSAPTLAYGVCDDNLTGLAGLGVVARLARFLGLPEKLAASVRRRRGGSDVQRLLALLYAACAGGGHLHAGDALGADDVARQTCGLRVVPDSRRLGEYLQRMHEAALEGLRECARLVSRRLVAQACGQRWGYVPVFVDSPGIIERSLGLQQRCESKQRAGLSLGAVVPFFGDPAGSPCLPARSVSPSDRSCVWSKGSRTLSGLPTFPRGTCRTTSLRTSNFWSAVRRGKKKNLSLVILSVGSKSTQQIQRRRDSRATTLDAIRSAQARPASAGRR